MSFNFGGAAAPAASSGFSFGGGATAAPAAGGFNFGGAPATAAPAAGGSTGFGFGAAPVAAAPAASSGFSFGGAPAASSSGFSFGGTAAAPAISTGGFNFGGAAAAPVGTTPSFGFGAAGATTKPPLFGAKSVGTSTATTGFGFGSTATTPATVQASGSTWGGFSNMKPATSSGFGFGTTTSGFGAAPATGSSVFGGGFGTAPGAAGAAPSAFGVAPTAPTAPAPIILATDASVAQLNTVKSAYQDPAQSRFKFLMYNTVDPTQRHLYVRPPHISERLWNQAELDNPDPLNCAPVPILGFPDLLKRIQAQQEHADKYNKYTDDLRAQLNEMDVHTRATEEKLEKCRHEHVQLFHALVKVMKDIEFLQNLGKPLQREEIQLAYDSGAVQGIDSVWMHNLWD
ncbi:hypothetical protein BBJ28_00015848 [Nothophytophthora sp. Chile5]|nr:hypothetical protein BBJ28_00015848 [Nothophytophthora sp. Chile5]